MFTDHLGYLGLTQEEIANATLTTDGLTDYFTINSGSVDMRSALWEQLLSALNFN
ncbi:MAG: hypothetical protein WA622_18085 [Mycobacterium sp.]|uniref:hypothetical protein n=1 Tax=Mycobacterium sp. TaxID=1785 RepID=UPI003BB4C98B